MIARIAPGGHSPGALRIQMPPELPSHTPRPGFLSIGHLSYDVHVDEHGAKSAPEPGGSAAFTSITAENLTGERVAAVTSSDRSWLKRRALRQVEAFMSVSDKPTVFEDRIIGNRRSQRLVSAADGLGDLIDQMDRDYATPDTLFASPLLDEIPLDCRIWFWTEFACLIPQGWFREVGDDGAVTLREPDVSSIVGPWDVIVLSEQEALTVSSLAPWKNITRVLAVTKGDKGALVFADGEEFEIPAVRPKKIVDTTGAGDVWAAAFCIRYKQSRDIEESGRFAAAAASVCVSRKGLRGVPKSREEISYLLRPSLKRRKPGRA